MKTNLKTLLAATAMLSIAVPASASGLYAFQCQQTQAFPSNRSDNDPIISTDLLVGFTSDHVRFFDATHKLKHNRKVTREDQYSHYKVTNPSCGLECYSYRWTGTYDRDRSVQMKGTLLLSAEGDNEKASYTEEQFKNGKMRSVGIWTCTPTTANE
jgi:hypothetical protein